MRSHKVKKVLGRIETILAEKDFIVAKAKENNFSSFYLNLINDSSEKLYFSLGVASCSNCDLYALSSIRLDDNKSIEKFLGHTNKIDNDINGMVEDGYVNLLSYLEIKYIYENKLDTIPPYPLGCSKSKIWLDPKRWEYLEYLQTELTYYFETGKLKDA